MRNTALKVISHTPNFNALTRNEEARLRRAQIHLLEQTNPDAPREEAIPEGYVPFLKTDGFTAEYTAHIRFITNPYGQGEKAYDPELWAKMPVQDELVKVWGWFHGSTGFSCMFRWASGRQDAYVILDTPNATEEAKEVQKQQIAAFKASIENFTKGMSNA